MQNENKYQTCNNEELLTKQIQNRSKIKWEKSQKMISNILTCSEVYTINLRIFGSEEGVKQNCYFLYNSKVNQNDQQALTISKSNVILK